MNVKNEKKVKILFHFKIKSNVPFNPRIRFTNYSLIFKFIWDIIYVQKSHN